jgi:hypothetical protein
MNWPWTFQSQVKPGFSLTEKVSPNILIFRNPQAFEVWSTCSLNIYSVITELGMLPSQEAVRTVSDEFLSNDQG